jgi:hypothetical protein
MIVDIKTTIRNHLRGPFGVPNQCGTKIIVFHLKPVYPHPSLRGAKLFLRAPAHFPEMSQMTIPCLYGIP